MIWLNLPQGYWGKGTLLSSGAENISTLRWTCRLESLTKIRGWNKTPVKGLSLGITGFPGELRGMAASLHLCHIYSQNTNFYGAIRVSSPPAGPAAPAPLLHLLQYESFTEPKGFISYPGCHSRFGWSRQIKMNLVWIPHKRFSHGPDGDAQPYSGLPRPHTHYQHLFVDSSLQ